MDEIKYTQFQIPPKSGDKNRSCMFKGEVFNLKDIVRITSVSTYTGINDFFFSVSVAPEFGEQFELTFRAPTKSEALRWQRELSRAYCKVGEYEERDNDDGVGQGS